MQNIALPFGTDQFEFIYDSEQWQILSPPDSALEAVTQTDILFSLANPIEGQPLEDIIDLGEKVVIAVSDSTRATGSERIVPLLIARLIECGLRTTDISILFATGIHRQPTEAEKRALLTDAIYRSIAHFEHHGENSDELVNLGETSYGTPVELNRRLVEADHVILTGAIGFHYFAGFTGGRKSVLPGLAAKNSIEKNHLLALDFSSGEARRRAGVGAGRLDGNAVNEDLREACSMLAPSFIVNSILNEKGEIVQLFCGDWYYAHRRGCAEYATRHTAPIEEKRDLIIASCGGSPKDINLIQAHKAIDMAVSGLKEGGELIILAECRDGYGRNDFLQWFDAPSSQQMAERLRDKYQVNGQTAWALKTKAERFKITLVSQLPPDEVRKIGMRPAANLDEALKLSPKGLSGFIIPHATAVIPVVKK